MEKPAPSPGAAGTPESRSEYPVVLHVTTERGWRGGERQVLLLMRHLDAAGVRQALAAPEGSPLARRVRRLGFATVDLHARVPLHPMNLLRLRATLGLGNRVVIHTHSSPALTLAGLLKRCRRVAAVLYTRRTAFPVRPSPKYRKSASRYIAVSEAARRELLRAGTPSGLVEVIPDAVDVDHVEEADEPDLGRLLEGLDRPLVVAVAHLAHEKGMDVLLKAWPLLLRQIPRASLAIAGDGPEWPALLTLCRELQIRSSVRLLGFRDRVGALLARANLFVMPSRQEGLGSAALEAMWWGLPVVGSNIGGIPEVVEHGVTGLLVPPERPELLASAISELIREPERRRRMGEAAAARARSRFAPSLVAQRHLEVYRRACPPAGVDRSPVVHGSLDRMLDVGSRPGTGKGWRSGPQCPWHPCRR